MSTDPIAALEYESIIFARHRNQYTGQAGTNAGVLDSSGYNLLTLLQLRGPSTIGELSAITGLDASTLNRQTKALLTKGFIERIPDPDGGIARKFHPTDLGNELLNEERTSSQEKYAELLSDWPEEDLRTFVKLLEKLNKAVETRVGKHWPRP